MEFQAVSWYGADIEDGVYNIYISGRTKEGESVVVNVQNFVFYFYAKVPPSWGRIQVHHFTEYLNFRLKENRIVSSKIVKKKCLYPFQNNEYSEYIRLCFNREDAFRHCKSMLNYPINVRKISGQPIEIEVFESNVEPLIRFTHLRNIRTTGWIKIDKYKKGDMYIVDWRNVSPCGDEYEDIAPFRILSWDIECQSSRGFPEFPDANIPGDFISQIGCSLHTYGGETKKVVFSSLECDGFDGLVQCDGEKDLLVKFFGLVESFDPDIFTGYNTWGFDDRYLYIRLTKIHKLDYLLESISRIPNMGCTLENKHLNSGAYGFNEFNIFTCPGRETFDLIMYIRREYKLDSYKLDSVAKHFNLDKGKEDMPYKRLFEILDKGNESPGEMKMVCEYCVQDAYLVVELMEKLCFIPNCIEMAKSTRVPMNWLLLKGQQCKVFSQMVYESRLNDFVVPVFKSTGKGEKFKGATVLTARRGAYFEPVAGLDFKSLYPSIMIAYNMCYSTLVVDQKYMDLPGIEYEVVEWVERYDDGTEKEYKFTFVQNVKGILPDILERLWESRNQCKREMKKCRGTFRAMVLNGKQLAIKVTMNSVYGFTGASNGMLPCKPIAASVTAKGREMIEITSKMAEELYSCITTYGDSVPGYQKVCLEGGSVRIDSLFGLGYNIVKYGDKEQIFPSGIDAWTHGGWSRLRRVIRHHTGKRLYRVKTDKGEVFVTEDHSLFGVDMCEIRPGDLKVGTRIKWVCPLEK